jgi:uncharacterized ubiquitin-like protein YukD
MKINMALKYALFPDRYIIQMSPVRTGSTFAYNILKAVCSNKSIEKHHNYSALFNRIPTVVTVRNPFDTLASMCRVNKFNISDETIVHICNTFRLLGGDDVLKVRNRSNVLIISYDRLVEDLSGIFDRLGEFFGVLVDEKLRLEITSNHGLDAASKMSHSKGDFAIWDAETKIHGDHISDRALEIGYGRECFTPKQIEYIQKALAPYFSAFDY